MKKMWNYAVRATLCAALMVVSAAATYAAGEDARLRIFSSQTKGEIEQKIKNNKWAGATLTHAHKEVDKYVDIHQSDTVWIISRLQMYWKNHYTTPYINGGAYSRAEGHAPVPTVRFTGRRDWASAYGVPSIEDIVPFMDYRDEEVYLQNNRKEGKPWEWVKSSQTAHQIEQINTRIMDKAMYAAFIYWLNGDEKYAKFAYDIFMTYIDGMYYREPPISEIDHRNAHVVGYTSFEVIHERILNSLPICYDFLYDYIKQQKGDMPKVHFVFQKFAEQMIKNGISNNNWNVFQACFLTYLALSLEDDATYENGKGQQYYIDFILNKTEPRQKAIREVCHAYDQETGMWHESAGYSVATTKDLMEILFLIDGMENKDILKDFAIIEKAALASFEYLLPNLMTIAFGDNQSMTLDYEMYESLLALYRKYNKKDKEKILVSILNQHIDAGIYNRDKGHSLYKLFSFVDDFDKKATSSETFYSTLFYAPNVNLTVQRNGMDKVEGMMIANAGTGFNHCNSNGINMELYGKGYPLGVDKARGSSYWSADHAEYYNRTVSHNTVLIDGVSDNTSPRMQDGEVSKHHKMLSNFPAKNLKDAAKPYALSYVDNQYFEEGTKSMQRRLSGIVRTSPKSGYYVDIFRSHKVDGGDLKHEYIYHNVGQSFKIYDTDGKQIAMQESQDLTSKGGQVKGYDYLTKKQEVDYNGNFKGQFALDLGKQGKVNMDVWVKGDEDRKIFSVMTPPSLKGLNCGFPKDVDKADIPAMIIRQNGEAWNRPFVVIYEPQTGEGTIKEVNYLESGSDDFVGVEVVSKSGDKEYIFNSTDTSKESVIKDIKAKVQSIYSVVSIRSDMVSYLFMGEGSNLSYGDYAITSESKDATALVEWVKSGIKVRTSAPVTLLVPKKGAPAQLSYNDSKGVQKSIVGVKSGKSMSYAVPVLDGVVLR